MPAQYGIPLIAATGEVLRLRVQFLVMGMTLSGVSLSQAMGPSFPVELPSVIEPVVLNPLPMDAVRTEMDAKSAEAIPAGSGLFFVLGSLVDDDEETENLRQHGACLKGNPMRTVALVGSAESFGSRTSGSANAEARRVELEFAP